MTTTVLIALFAAMTIASGTDGYDPFESAKHARVNGTELTYVEYGAGGIPVIFVHGSGADLRTWGYQLQYFAKSRRAIAYSRRYHHPNPWVGDGRDYSPTLHAADLAAFITEVSPGPVDLVAASYGGVVGLLVARDHPALIRRLVLVEPVVFSLLPGGTETAKDAERLDLAREQLLRGESEAALRTLMATIIAPGAYDLMPETARQMLHDNLRELQAEARVPTVSLSPLYTCADARRVRTPTLLLVGASSAPFLKVMAEKVAECLPARQVLVIPGAAHALHAQQVNLFNQAVEQFLSDMGTAK